MSRFERLTRAEPIATGLRELADLRVKDVPGFVRENFTKDAVLRRARIWRDRYKQKYIDTGSIQPLYDALLAIGLLSYAISWPVEMRHLRAIEELRRLQLEREKQQQQQQQYAYHH
jgi:hypothetical protein